MLVSVFGLVLQDDDLRGRVTDEIVDRLPVDAAGRADVEDAIEALATPASAAGLVSLLVFLWAATGMMTALRRGLDAATGGTSVRPVVRGKLVDLAAIGATAALLILAVGVGVVAEVVDRFAAEAGGVIGTDGERAGE